MLVNSGKSEFFTASGLSWHMAIYPNDYSFLPE